MRRCSFRITVRCVGVWLAETCWDHCFQHFFFYDFFGNFVVVMLKSSSISISMKLHSPALSCLMVEVRELFQGNLGSGEKMNCCGREKAVLWILNDGFFIIILFV